MRIAGKTEFKRVYDYCIRQLYGNVNNSICVKSAGLATTKAVLLAELLKRRVHDLH